MLWPVMVWDGTRWIVVAVASDLSTPFCRGGGWGEDGIGDDNAVDDDDGADDDTDGGGV